MQLPGEKQALAAIAASQKQQLDAERALRQFQEQEMAAMEQIAAVVGKYSGRLVPAFPIDTHYRVKGVRDAF